MKGLTGEILEIFVKEGSTIARVRVDGSIMLVPLLLLMNAQVGDQVIIDAGIALTRVERKNVTSGRKKSVAVAVHDEL